MEVLNDEEFLLRGDEDVKVPAHLNFGKYMLDRLRRMRNEIALINAQTGEKLTFKEFTQYSVDLAVSLAKLGVGRGDVVALGSENRITFLPITLAIIFTGATYTPYEIMCGKAVLKHKMSITNPKYFICSKLFFETHCDVLTSSKTIKTFITLDEDHKYMSQVSGITLKSLMSEHFDVNKFEPAKVQGQIDTTLILYSSGTTGMPKGIELTHLNFILNCTADDFKSITYENVFNGGEWYHIYDTFLTYKLLYQGKKIIYLNDFTVELFLKSIQEYQVNVAIVVPAIITLLSMNENLDKYNLESLRVIISSTTPLHEKTITKVRERLPKLDSIIQIYVMTEAATITSEVWGPKGPKQGSVGSVYPGVTVKVVDVNTQKAVGPNKPGEIRVKGSLLMKGYIGVDPATYLDEQGFFKTGDLGYYDDDGYLYIVDRVKEIIDYNGYKIAPPELEAILNLHPAVLESGVVGKPVPVYGEEPAAFVVKKPGAILTEKELIDFIAPEIAHYMQLRGGVKFIPEIPRNPRGKILRRQLRDMLSTATNDIKK